MISKITTRTAATTAVALLLWAAVAAQVPDRGRADTETRRVNDRLRALQAEADALAAQSRTLVDDLRKLELDRQIQIERANQAQQEVARNQAAIEDSARRLAALEEQRTAQLPDVKAQLVDLYERGRTGYARLLFGSTSVREFGRSLRAVAALIRINENRVAEH